MEFHCYWFYYRGDGPNDHRLDKPSCRQFGGKEARVVNENAAQLNVQLRQICFPLVFCCNEYSDALTGVVCDLRNAVPYLSSCICLSLSQASNFLQPSTLAYLFIVFHHHRLLRLSASNWWGNCIRLAKLPWLWFLDLTLPSKSRKSQPNQT